MTFCHLHCQTGQPTQENIWTYQTSKKNSGRTFESPWIFNNRPKQTKTVAILQQNANLILLNLGSTWDGQFITNNNYSSPVGFYVCYSELFYLSNSSNLSRGKRGPCPLWAYSFHGVSFSCELCNVTYLALGNWAFWAFFVITLHHRHRLLLFAALGLNSVVN